MNSDGDMNDLLRALREPAQSEIEDLDAEAATTAGPIRKRKANPQSSFTTAVVGNEPWRSAAQTLLDEANVTWSPSKSSNSGVAKTDGSRRIIAPAPKGRVSFAVFAHEVAHVVLHERNGKVPRWQEEVEAIEFALDAFTRFELPGKGKQRKADVSPVAYAFHKAIRRGADPEAIRKAYPGWWKRVVQDPPDWWRH
jgi:hypothetical protein